MKKDSQSSEFKLSPNRHPPTFERTSCYHVIITKTTLYLHLGLLILLKSGPFSPSPSKLNKKTLYCKRKREKHLFFSNIHLFHPAICFAFKPFIFLPPCVLKNFFFSFAFTCSNQKPLLYLPSFPIFFHFTRV